VMITWGSRLWEGGLAIKTNDLFSLGKGATAART
jgi:hypothetical protein